MALAFLHHADASGDEQFLRTEVWPVVSGVADWITSRVSRTRQGYAIRDGGGPAERAQTDDNDAATVVGARLVLERAADLADRLGRSSGTWRTVADGLNPAIRSDGVIAAHDGYRSDEEKGATPSPLLALFPFWADIDPDVAAKTLRFYLELWPDYVGAPMLAALYPTWAAWSGDRNLALKLMDEGYGLYQYGRFQQTLEYRMDKVPGGVAAGPFVANIGGFLTGLLFGLPGVKVSAGQPEAWPSRPVVLPAGWRAIECDQLWLRGEAFQLRARQGDDRAELTRAGRSSA